MPFCADQGAKRHWAGKNFPWSIHQFDHDHGVSDHGPWPHFETMTMTMTMTEKDYDHDHCQNPNFSWSKCST